MAETAFHDLCTQCGDCAGACPEGIISRGKDGFPRLDLAAGACTFCSECIAACETGALRPKTPWPWRATAAETCLSMNGVSCRVCDDQCDARAIRFRLATGGRSFPTVDAATCTGCGACVAPCPVGALTLVQTRPHMETHPC